MASFQNIAQMKRMRGASIRADLDKEAALAQGGA